MCFQGLKLTQFQWLSLIPRYNKFTKVLIRVPSTSPIHVESKSSFGVVNQRGQYFSNFTANHQGYELKFR